MEKETNDKSLEPIVLSEIGSGDLGWISNVDLSEKLKGKEVIF